MHGQTEGVQVVVARAAMSLTSVVIGIRIRYLQVGFARRRERKRGIVRVGRGGVRLATGGQVQVWMGAANRWLAAARDCRSPSAVIGNDNDFSVDKHCGEGTRLRVFINKLFRLPRCTITHLAWSGLFPVKYIETSQDILHFLCSPLTQPPRASFQNGLQSVTHLSRDPGEMPV